MPEIRLGGTGIRYDGRTIGQTTTDESNGEIVAVIWKSLFRRHNSYALTVDVLENMDDDISMLFMVDKDSDMVYKFPRKVYEDAEIVFMNGQSQFVPDRGLNHGKWPMDECIIG